MKPISPACRQLRHLPCRSPIALFHRHFRGRHHGRGQALYSSLAFGGGGAFGALYSGMGWESLGAAIIFALAAALALIAAVIAWRWIEVPR